MATPKVNPDEAKWRADSDLSTLIEAEKIKGDKTRYKAALAAKKERMAALKKVDGEDKDD